jgi:hypothetical protein
MNNFYLYRKAWRFDGAPHEEPQLEKEEWRALLRQGGLLVRNTYDFDCSQKTPFWNLIKDHFGGLEELSGNTRKKVRRSLEKLDFKPIDIDLIEQQGFPILKATYDDYAVTDRVMDQKTFGEYIGLCKSKRYDYWGIFYNEKMIGFCANWLWDDAVEYGLVGVLPEYKRECTVYPYYGLFYSMNQYYLQEKGFRYVTDGSRSITEHSNIQPFLEEKFHFRKSYCHLAIHYKWWMKVAVKLLYPFRRLITIPSVKAVLNMESMRTQKKQA